MRALPALCCEGALGCDDIECWFFRWCPPPPELCRRECPCCETNWRGSAIPTERTGTVTKF